MTNQLTLINLNFEQKVSRGLSVMDQLKSEDVQKEEEEVTGPPIGKCYLQNPTFEDENPQSEDSAVFQETPSKSTSFSSKRRNKKKHKKKERREETSRDSHRRKPFSDKTDKIKSNANKNEHDILVQNPASDPTGYLAILKLAFDMNLCFDNKKIKKDSYQAVVGISIDDEEVKGSNCSVKSVGFGKSREDAGGNALFGLIPILTQIFGEVKSVKELKKNFKSRDLRNVFTQQ